jgi:elongation factor P
MLARCGAAARHRAAATALELAHSLRVPRRHAQITAFDLRAGDLIEYGDGKELWRVAACNFSRQAQGRAFTQAELRNLKTGLKKDVRMRTDEVLEKATLDSPRKLTVLYTDKTNMALMDPETFEQTEMPIAALGSAGVYLQEGMDVRVELYNGVPATVSIPSKVAIEVVEITPLSSGRAEGGASPAVLANGTRTKVPKHVKVGDKVLVSTEDGSYLGKDTA